MSSLTPADDVWLKIVFATDLNDKRLYKNNN